MSTWLIGLIALAGLSGLIIVVRRWGKAAAHREVLKKSLKAVRTRKAIDAKVQKLTPDELRDRLRRGM